MKNKFFSKYLAIIIIVISPITLYSQYLTEDIFKFSRAMGYISNYYVDTVNSQMLVETALISVLKELDPHSVYIPEKEVKEMNQPLEGNFEGIGIQFNLLKDTIFIISPISGGPSEKVGLRAGDRIIKINDEEVAGKNISTTGVRDRLMGDKGTKVNVTIKRTGVYELLTFTITRDKIPIFSVDAAYLIDKNIAYIKINRFALTTVEEFVEKAKILKEKGATSLILDLRDNGGGFLDKAIELSDHFLDDKKLIVYTEGMRSLKTESFATSNGVFQNGNIVILIDEGSASASEIVAGAVQDWDRGIIIGRRSFGKGLVQKPFYLPDGSMIRLTVARYYTPTGRAIQKPYSEGVDKYEAELLKRYKHGELLNKDSISFPDSLKYYTLTNKRIVFGGGGIMPDIFVPIDTTQVTPYYSKMLRQGVLNSFVLEYVDKNRKSLKSTYTDFKKFSEKFEANDKILNELFAYGLESKIEATQDEMEKSKLDFALIIKALIARDLWEMSEYYQIVNVRDKGFNKAIEVLKHWDKYHAEVLINQ